MFYKSAGQMYGNMEELRMRKRIGCLVVMFALFALTGCGESRTKQLQAMLESGEQIEIALTIPEGMEEVRGKWRQWEPLSGLGDQRDMRKAVDDTLGTTVFGNSKNGAMYVNPENGEWEPNNTIENVFKNKAFIEMIEKEDVQEKLNQLMIDSYADLEDTTDGEMLKVAWLNMYFNIFPENEESAEFNGNDYLNRAQFMSGIARAHLQAQVHLQASEEAINCLGDVEETEYAELISQYTYLDLESGSLNEKNFKGLMTRAEAAYMIACIYYADEMNNVDTTVKNVAYSDIKNEGNIGEDAAITGKEQYKTAILKYMIEHPKKGLDEALYRALVVCYNHGIFGNGEMCRWNEPITKAEALEALVNVYVDLGTEIESYSGNNQRIDVTYINRMDDLSENAIYTKAGSEYKMEDFENAGSLYYLKQVGTLPPISYAEWQEKMNSQMCEFEDWLQLSASQRKTKLSAHMYMTVKNHLSLEWMGKGYRELIEDLTPDQQLWLDEIYTYSKLLSMGIENDVNYKKMGITNEHEVWLYETTKLKNTVGSYNYIIESELETLTEEEQGWYDKVVALEEKERQASQASQKKQTSNSSNASSSNAAYFTFEDGSIAYQREDGYYYKNDNERYSLLDNHHALRDDAYSNDCWAQSQGYSSYAEYLEIQRQQREQKQADESGIIRRPTWHM